MALSKLENKYFRRNSYDLFALIVGIGCKWCSILVREAVFEDGPKNPFKGISMKFLVPACYAQ